MTAEHMNENGTAGESAIAGSNQNSSRQALNLFED